jgi:hypothetical protein
MLSKTQIQEVLDAVTAGRAIKSSRRSGWSDLGTDAYFAVTERGLYAIVEAPRFQRIKVGGGVHLQILEPIANELIGPAAVLVNTDSWGETRFLTVFNSGTRWLVFRSVNEFDGSQEA